LRTPLIHAYVRDDGHASLVEFSSLAVAHNFGDTLRAYEEAYHAKIHLADASHAAPAETEGITSAHDRVAFLHTILPGDADPDERPRGIFVDSMVGANDMLRPLDFYAAGELPGTWIATGEGWRIEKTYQLDGDALSIRFRAEGKTLPKLIETELNLAMPSCDGYGGRYVLADGRVPGGFGEALDLASALQITLDDSELHGSLRIEASQPVRLEARPHRTVSQSEAGFEKIMQAVCIALSWSPASGADQRITLRVIPAS
jgi:alpha-amylase